MHMTARKVWVFSCLMCCSILIYFFTLHSTSKNPPLIQSKLDANRSDSSIHKENTQPTSHLRAEASRLQQLERHPTVSSDGTRSFKTKACSPGHQKESSLGAGKLPVSHIPVFNISNGRTKADILRSCWIQCFPHLVHMVKNINESDRRAITSAQYTSINLEGGQIIKTSHSVKAKITARDTRGHRKKYGGDFFKVILRRPMSKTDGIMCEVEDNMDGSYNASCLLPWKGKAIVTAVLIHPSEAIFHLIQKFSSEQEYGLTMNATMRNSENKTEITKCSVGYPTMSDDQLCDYSSPRHGEKKKCVKPPSGECGLILWVEQGKRDKKKLQIFDDYFVQKTKNFIVPIKGSGTKLSVEESQTPTLFIGDLSQVSMNPSTPTGWWYGSKWHSFKVKNKDFSSERLRRCVRNKTFHFLGDSTTRQWYFFFTNSLNLVNEFPENIVARSRPRQVISEELNATFYFKGHGYPLYNPASPDFRPYLSDTLENIVNAGEGTYIFITIGLHFELLHPDVYFSRLKIIKPVIQSLLERQPGTKIFIKGLPHHMASNLLTSPWLTYRYNVLLRHVFGGMKDVTIFECWDYTTVLNLQDVHPRPQDLSKIVGLLLSFLGC